MQELSKIIFTQYPVDRAALRIEHHITLTEFEATLCKVKGKAPGRDRVSYPMLKNLPAETKTLLIELYNCVLDTGIIPQNWKLASILPIPKPRKDKSIING